MDGITNKITKHYGLVLAKFKCSNIYLFIKKRLERVWNGHGADSEIGNVSARQAALKRWTATDKRWNRKVVSRGSVVTLVERLPI